MAKTCRHADTEEEAAPVPVYTDNGIILLRPPNIPYHEFEPNGVARLDAALRSAVEHGWPVWRTPGGGGAYPKKQDHIFPEAKLQFGARVDFYRGTAKDDLANQRWRRLYEQLPSYRAYMKRHQGPTNTNSIGNAMEQSCGVAYAAATGGEFLT